VPAAPEAVAKTEADALFSQSLNAAKGILVAVSGGPDSIVMMALLAEWASGKIKLCAATVDHGLRTESADETAMVAAFAKRLKVPHATLHWTSEKPATGVQNAARNARYALLIHHAQQVGCSHIVTAHHADDQAETVLMRLIAGSGIHGLAGMREQTMRDSLVLSRPFLSIPKSRLIATCLARELSYITDPSNSHEQYGRVKIRRLLVPLVREGLTAARLCKLAARAAQADDALTEITEKVVSSLDLKSTGCILQFHWGKVSNHPTEIRLRVLAETLRCFTSLKAQLKLERVETLLADIDLGFSKKTRIRRTLSDLIVTLQSSGLLTITAAPIRKRGRKPHTGTVLDQ
jgi:tRNA(Ile)-lysidine synthase